MKKIGLYYVIHAVINAVLLITFHNSIVIHYLSMAPLVLIAIVLFNLLLFKEQTEEKTYYGDTAYSESAARLSFEEQKEANAYFHLSFLLMIPFEIPFIFFLPSYFKLFSLVPFILAYVLGGLISRKKMGERVKARLDAEKQELAEQKRREELGLK